MQALYFSSPTPPQQPVRVRSSCDSCSAAKVRCDKTRPSCERCSSNQLQCIYSVSRRHGSKRRVAYEPAITTNVAPPRSSADGGGPSESAAKRQGHDTVNYATSNNRESGESSTVNEGLNFNNRNDLPDLFQYPGDDDFTMSLDVDSSKFSSFAFSNYLPTSYDPSQHSNLPHHQQEPEPASWTPFTSPSTASIHGEDFRMVGDDLALPTASKAINGRLTRPTDCFNTPNQTSGNEKSNEVHDCEAHALNLLRSLHHWPLYPSDEPSQITTSKQTRAVLDAQSPNSNASPEAFHSLDTILHANKSALSGVLQLLDCSCAQRPHLATLYISIITKMLSLYERAATTDISSPESRNPASSASATQGLPGPRLARTTLVQLGVFDLDEDDQASLLRGILLRQLRKMEGAIEKFASLGYGDPDKYDVSVRQWLNVAVSMIKKELQRIYQNCEERLLVNA